MKENGVWKLIRGTSNKKNDGPVDPPTSKSPTQPKNQLETSPTMSTASLTSLPSVPPSPTDSATSSASDLHSSGQFTEGSQSTPDLINLPPLLPFGLPSLSSVARFSPFKSIVSTVSGGIESAQQSVSSGAGRVVNKIAQGPERLSYFGGKGLEKVLSLPALLTPTFYGSEPSSANHSTWSLLESDDREMFSTTLSDDLCLEETEEDKCLKANRLHKFLQVLATDDIDLRTLRVMSYEGIPPAVRATTWKYLLGYWTPSAADRSIKAKEYRDTYKTFITDLYEKIEAKDDIALLRQISIDVPRTNPSGYLKLFQQSTMQKMMERVLYIWSKNHSHIGYFQGLSDHVSPFFLTFLSTYVHNVNIVDFDMSTLPADDILQIETDTYWCMCRMHFCPEMRVGSQHGLLSMVNKLKGIIKILDPALADHLEEEGMDYIHFSFRWMVCLLSRELPLDSIIRLWDTYFADIANFYDLHVYVCAALLHTWSVRLLDMHFSELMIFLQNLPSQYWSVPHLEHLIKRSFDIRRAERRLYECFVIVMSLTLIISILLLVFIISLFSALLVFSLTRTSIEDQREAGEKKDQQ